MITDRSQTRTTKNRVTPTEPIVTRVRNHSLERKKRSNNVVHVKIRPSSRLQPTDNNLVEVIRLTEHHHGRTDQQETTINRESSTSSKSTPTRSSVRVTRLHRFSSKSSRTTGILNTSSERSIRSEVIHRHKHGDTLQSRICRSSSAKVAHHDTTNVSWDGPGLTKDYHKDPKKDPKKCPTRRCVIGSVLAAVLFILITAIILVVLLLKLPKTKATQTPIPNPSLRWNITGITVVGNSSDPLKLPFGVTVDYANTLYIADSGNNRVQKYLMGASTGTTVAGDINKAHGSSQNQLYSPSGIIVDSNGGIFISDTGNNRIQFWSNGASVGTTVAGIGGVGNQNNQLNSPYGIDYDSNTGKLYIADANNTRVMSYASGDSSGTIVAGGHGVGWNTNQLYYPFGLYFDSVSNSLVNSQFSGNYIVRWVLGATSWSLLAGDSHGLAGDTSTLLNGPGDVTLDPMGNMYVADAKNHRIQLFMAGQSQAITIAGVSGVNGTNSTMLKLPFGVELDSQLNLYVADTFNQRIQKFVRY